MAPVFAFVVTLLMAAVSMAASLPRHEPHRQIKRIVGGEFAPNGMYRSTVYVSFMAGRRCGGVLISQNTVLTAGHCVSYNETLALSIFAGSHVWNQSKALSIVTGIIHYSDFNKPRYHNDIAILKLGIPIPESEFVSHAKVGKDEVSGDARVTAVGWGSTTNATGPGVEKLRRVHLSVMDQDKCAQAFKNQTESPLKDVGKTMICAGEKGKGSCAGDDGSPLYAWGTDTVVGIASLGPTCGSDQAPVIYTRLSQYTLWISRNM
ncbi:hypothetical protein LOZ66_002695 [Ophidiomyces ophidiicola]|nr:hypothetical protein LOZ65_004513 [Ophidiomyces ophidiicola]KAI1939383.1 hypothetical protein LOZ66_002695 [Ophidiomyces ophidiicola]